MCEKWRHTTGPFDFPMRHKNKYTCLKFIYIFEAKKI